MPETTKRKSLWSIPKRAHSTLTKIARRRVHKDNYFGSELRGTAVEEEMLAAAIELGVGWLHRTEAGDSTAPNRSVGFTDGFGVECRMEAHAVNEFRRVRHAFGVSDLEHAAVLARGSRPRGMSSSPAGSPRPSAADAGGDRVVGGDACSGGDDSGNETDAPIAPSRQSTSTRRPSFSRMSRSQRSSMRMLGMSAAAGKSLAWFLVTHGMECERAVGVEPPHLLCPSCSTIGTLTAKERRIAECMRGHCMRGPHQLGLTRQMC